MVNVDDITYSYNIMNFFAYPTKDNFKDVVFSIFWELIATYIDPDTEKSYISNFTTRSNVDTDNITNFIPFEELTLEQTIEWISSVEDMNSIKKFLCDNINNQINPPPPSIVVLNPPFNQ